MGIGRFYRWLSERYPLINEKITQASLPEFDNLYLDMNGILHTCSHGNSGGMLHESEDAMWVDVFAALDLIISTVNPKKFLVLAADGVAPRAKMNQQRARRYRAAKDAAELARQKEEHRLLKMQRKQDKSAPQSPPSGGHFDSNCISPGTEFMAKFFRHLRFFCEKKLNEDARWKHLKVVLSGPDVPGEGEHKIMQFIRCSKSDPHSGRNVRHCLYGLDADLIMLSLASHEPHFCLLREEVVFGKAVTKGPQDRLLTKRENLQLLHISLLREYLFLEFAAVALRAAPALKSSSNEKEQPSRADGAAPAEIVFDASLGSPSLRPSLLYPRERERIIDDYVLFCFMVGNDFLPHPKATDIADGGLDLLMTCYKEYLQGYAVLAEQAPSPAGPWLSTGCGQIDFCNFFLFLSLFVDTVETDLLQEWAADSQWIQSKRRNAREAHAESKPPPSGDALLAYRQAFYLKKMGMDGHTPEGRKQIDRLAVDYLEGLQWVLYYYFRGPHYSGWDWFYPHHYAPFMTDVLCCSFFTEGVKDLADLRRKEIRFPASKPYAPFMQLLSILPPKSASLLPKALRQILLSPSLELLPYFPTDFEVDMEGCTVPWGGVTLLPFIEEKLLYKEALPLFSKLTGEEARRNTRGKNVLLYRDRHLRSRTLRRLAVAAQTAADEAEALESSSAIQWFGGEDEEDPVMACRFFFFRERVAEEKGRAPPHKSLLDASLARAAASLEPRKAISSLPSVFPSLKHSCVREEVIEVCPPAMVVEMSEKERQREGGGVSDGKLPGGVDVDACRGPALPRNAYAFPNFVLTGTKPLLAEFPSLHRLNFEWDYFVGVKVFNSESKKNSVLIQVVPPYAAAASGASFFAPVLARSDDSDGPSEAAHAKLTRAVEPFDPAKHLLPYLRAPLLHYDFPFLRLAKPVAVWLPNLYYALPAQSLCLSSFSPAFLFSSPCPVGVEESTPPLQQQEAVAAETRRLKRIGLDFPANAAYAALSARASPTQPKNEVSLPLATQSLSPSALARFALSSAEDFLRLAELITFALPGQKAEVARRSAHPATLPSSILLELNPVRAVEVFADARSPAVVFEEKPVFRLLPLVSLPVPLPRCLRPPLAPESAQAGREETAGGDAQWREGTEVLVVDQRESMLACCGEVVAVLQRNHADRGKEDKVSVLFFSPWAARDRRQDNQQKLQWNIDRVIRQCLPPPLHTVPEAAALLKMPLSVFYAVASSFFLKLAERREDCGLHIIASTRPEKIEGADGTATFVPNSSEPLFSPGYSYPLSMGPRKDGDNPRRGPGSRMSSHLLTPAAIQAVRDVFTEYPAVYKRLFEVCKEQGGSFKTPTLTAASVFASEGGDFQFTASMFVSAMERHPCRKNKLVKGSYTWMPKDVLPSLESVVDASFGKNSGASSGSPWKGGASKPRKSRESRDAAAAETSERGVLRENGVGSQEDVGPNRERDDLPVLQNFEPASLLPASSADALRKKIIAGFFSLVSTASRPSGVVEGRWTLRLFLGQRVAYITQAGCIYQGSRGTVTGLCSVDGSIPFRISGDTAFETTLSVKASLGRRGAKGGKGGDGRPEAWAWWDEAEIAGALQGILQDIVVEVLLDHVQLGAQNMDGRCASLRLIRVPCIELFPLVSRPASPSGSAAPSRGAARPETAPARRAAPVGSNASPLLPSAGLRDLARPATAPDAQQTESQAQGRGLLPHPVANGGQGRRAGGSSADARPGASPSADQSRPLLRLLQGGSDRETAKEPAESTSGVPRPGPASLQVQQHATQHMKELLGIKTAASAASLTGQGSGGEIASARSAAERPVGEAHPGRGDDTHSVPQTSAAQTVERGASNITSLIKQLMSRDTPNPQHAAEPIVQSFARMNPPAAVPAREQTVESRSVSQKPRAADAARHVSQKPCEYATHTPATPGLFLDSRTPCTASSGATSCPPATAGTPAASGASPSMAQQGRNLLDLLKGKERSRGNLSTPENREPADGAAGACVENEPDTSRRDEEDDEVLLRTSVLPCRSAASGVCTAGRRGTQAGGPSGGAARSGTARNSAISTGRGRGAAGRGSNGFRGSQRR
ncbi:putative 5'-3' exonuclease [Neospora caninum Liverpool]|uniref:5'-3' exonuclease, putative n=1 Tax=Neospora caninum (strain Liverpool) TaxID=572307 RepID=F0VE48_NEOCL|nr:putative 5'-3' exonuclease [Neospora caninum Liverpool]CBZ51991.1 putative 5'-3' exonuclease [Neospora caninum Liverpool]CEL65951.1 TPA: 5'-3' exonuclease, putative [Neospora caninum Liverpool]|eukprot:XP_003882024.1 putative 5'-3' exonuclease [Neospora caninum Liverpool]